MGIYDHNYPLTNVGDEFFSYKKSNTLVQNQLYKTINTRMAYSQKQLSVGIQTGVFNMNEKNDLYSKTIDTFLYGIASTDQLIKVFFKKTVNLRNEILQRKGGILF
ncbi:TetR family transcriptional regulator C-terminal domain-containing protein [Oceanobacillus salinisoli]|uniref:TetR family transcriptional regulator C-terminal domain-containing protein n=1 Tax=Oceanobacillus salinisoli TaxID=2678611 RepID=UPI0018CC29D8|nr:TetR family transcriptional regulator C-terminal domain-containing protein [Oceanobacillus salinisoli]